MTATGKVDLNADLGESFGLYTLGNDAALIPHLTSVNIACGYHAADPAIMRATVRLARDHGTAIGAHVSYPDFGGFGRRRMELSEDEVRDAVVHQIGALLGFCRAEGVEMQHVKPHGMLYLTAEIDRPTARGIAEAVKSVDPDLILMLAGDIVAEECAHIGLTMAHEGYIDLDYAPDGTLQMPNPRPPRDPVQMIDRARILVREQRACTTDGTWRDVPTQSICFHGETPNAPEIAAAVNAALKADGIDIVGLRDVVSAQPKPLQAAG